MKLLSILFILFFSLSLSAQNIFQLSGLKVKLIVVKTKSYIVVDDVTVLEMVKDKYLSNKKGVTYIFKSKEKEIQTVYFNDCVECPPSYFYVYLGDILRVFKLNPHENYELFTYSEVYDQEEMGLILLTSR